MLLFAFFKEGETELVSVVYLPIFTELRTRGSRIHLGCLSCGRPPALGVQSNVGIATWETGCPSAISTSADGAPQQLTWKCSEERVQRRQAQKANRTPWGLGKYSCPILYLK